MESLEELKAIIKNAPKYCKATHIDDECRYLKCDDEYYWSCFTSLNFWVDVDSDEFGDFTGIRSLSDINRIIELMENQKKAYKSYESLESVKQKYNGENKTAKAMLRLAYDCDEFALPADLRKDIKNFLGDL